MYFNDKYISIYNDWSQCYLNFFLLHFHLHYFIVIDLNTCQKLELSNPYIF